MLSKQTYQKILGIDGEVYLTPLEIIGQVLYNGLLINIYYLCRKTILHI